MSAAAMALLAVAVASAAFVQGALGVGFALVLAPLLGVVMPSLLPSALLLLMLPLNAAAAWRERGALDRRGVGRITIGRVAGGVIGLLVLEAVPAGRLQLLVGVATIATALATLAAPRFVPGLAAFLGAGVVTGITETATGIGGPPLALVYQHRPAAVLRASVAACFLVGELFSIALLLGTGRLPFEQLAAAVVLLPPLALGLALSGRAGQRVDGPRFRALILGFAVLSGLVCLIPT